MTMQPWAEWQREVVAILQEDFEEALRHISTDEIDWPLWHKFYAQGRSPRSAIDHALERVL